MTPTVRTVKLSEILFDESIYPRKSHDPALVQRYFECLEEIEARGNFISVAADNTLLDGRHRHLAYQKKHNGNGHEADIQVFGYPVTDAGERFALAVELNASHGHQLTLDDKQRCAVDLYTRYRRPIDEIARMVGVRRDRVTEWTRRIREDEEKRLNERIFDLWLACRTNEEIGQAVGLTHVSVGSKIEVLKGTVPGPKLTKLSHFEDAGDDASDFKRPIYNVWKWQTKSNSVEHHGMSEQRILENLLYLYTEPFDIVIDPFAGGGSTIDVCKRRLRRYWTSDRKPILERAEEIRLLDVARDLPALNNRWGDVALTYLDPPYWKQAAGKYSEDAEDLANMPLDEFTAAVASVVDRIAGKQKRGIIALLIQPTQWSAEERQFTDHIFDILRAVKGKNLTVENRVLCTYETSQYNAQQVQWAKDQRKLLVLSRELVIWRVSG